jgi:hypothetical protein
MLVLVLALLTGLVIMVVGERAYRGGTARLMALIGQVVDLGSLPPGAPTEGRLVRVAGPVSVAQPLVDPQTGVTALAVMLRREVEMRSTVEMAVPGGTARTVPYWVPMRAIAVPPGWPAGLLSSDLSNPAVRIADAALHPTLARASGFGPSRSLPAEAVRPALDALLPGRVMASEEGWTYLAGADGAGAMARIRYHAVPTGGIATAIGVQRTGVLLPPGQPWRSGVPYNADVADLLPYDVVENPGEWRLMGRLFGGLMIVLGVMIAALGRAANDGRLASAMQWEPVALLVMLPFAVLAAPAIVAAAVLAWWMAQGWTQLAVGAAAAPAAAALTLWLSYRSRGPAPS